MIIYPEIGWKKILDSGRELNACSQLDSTSPNDYSGSRPPKRSYEDEISGLDLFAFVVKIDRFPVPVYYKFSLTKDELWLVSLHKDKKNKEVP